ncbi:two-component system response regulator [Marinobacterium sp. AK62]|uniref:Two-component system response regulator n=1 Tax=Marinobacterium alkalitolerans TaxID=1542925 RepID=A0ABS3Z7E0_9GAMM|nr:two-component system response regulator [Marinobacterium alkalitolerans]MBP0047521.1 two-component system response regulator [Marinobacterium alkalitolerans]
MAEENTSATILIVDDTPENIDILNDILRPSYRVTVALNGMKAIAIAASSPPPDLILLDIMMPEMDGYEVIRRLKSNPATARIPVIFVTAKTDVSDEEKGLQLGAVDYISKPISPPIVKARIKTHLALYDQNRALESKVRARTAALRDSRLQIIRRLGRAAEFKDNETGQHVMRMSHYAHILAAARGMDEAWCSLILEAAPMHDIGKIGVPDQILLKPGKLTQEEWSIMKRHPEFGAEILGRHDSDLLRMARSIAQNHHEKWDGSGYPGGLKGQDIPIEGRIVAVADVFDALTTERPYKHAWPVDEALDYLRQEAGRHFDPDLIPLFMDSLPSILEVKARYAEHVPLDDVN